MRLLSLLATIVLLFTFNINTNAQTAFADDYEIYEVKGSLLKLQNQNWTFTSDQNENLIYVDFEKVHVHLNSLSVKDSQGVAVFSDEIWNLPVDSIYELDFSKYKKGEYEILLNTMTSSFSKKIMIN